MTLQDLQALEGIESLHSEFTPEEKITGGYTSDLLSDVMSNAKDGNILITIQAHNNTVAVASLAGIIGIVVAGGRPVPEDMLISAQRETIAVFRTKVNQFDASHQLAKALGL